MGIYYSDGELIQEFDHVLVSCPANGVGVPIGEAQICKVYPRKKEVKVSYFDYFDCRRKDAQPKRKSCLVSISNVELVTRDG